MTLHNLDFSQRHKFTRCHAIFYTLYVKLDVIRGLNVDGYAIIKGGCDCMHTAPHARHHEPTASVIFSAVTTDAVAAAAAAA